MAKYRQRKLYLESDSKRRAGETQLASLLERQILFKALYQGLNAGMPPAASLAVIEEDVARITSKGVIADLENGRSVTEAMLKHGLVNHFDRSIISIGETSGQLAETTHRIAERYDRIVKRKQYLKSKLRGPLIVSLLAIFVLPLPDFLSGAIEPWQYFTTVLISMFLIISAWKFVKYIFINRSTDPDGYPAHRFIGIPLIEGLLTDYSRANFIEYFHLLFASGYPIIEAVELSDHSLVGFARRQRYRDLAPDLHQGYSLADAFEYHRILSPTQLPILITGEEAGRLEESLQQLAVESRGILERKIDMFVTWFPRAVYAAVTLIIAAKIL